MALVDTGAVHVPSEDTIPDSTSDLKITVISHVKFKSIDRNFPRYKAAAATQSTTAQTETVRNTGNVISQEFHY